MAYRLDGVACGVAISIAYGGGKLPWEAGIRYHETAMRTFLLIPLLLLGGLQAAVRPAAPAAELAGPLRVSGRPLPAAPAPAETQPALRMLPDAPSQSALQGNGKQQKAVPAPAPCLAPARGRSSRSGVPAGLAATDPLDQRPAQPRAPPASLPF